LYWQLVFKSITDFEIAIAITIPIRRNLTVSSHPPGLTTCRIQKPFRKIRSAISGSRSDPEKDFSNAIMIAIEKPIRINQTLIKKFSSDFDFSFSIKV
jgi:hypothetical protein